MSMVNWLSYDKSLIHFFIGHDFKRELFILQRLLQHKTSSLDNTPRTYSNRQSHSKFDKCSQPCQNKIKRNQVPRLYFRFFMLNALNIEQLQNPTMGVKINNESKATELASLDGQQPKPLGGGGGGLKCILLVPNLRPRFCSKCC